MNSNQVPVSLLAASGKRERVGVRGSQNGVVHTGCVLSTAPSPPAPLPKGEGNPSRRGISLMEVLISVFVLSIGLMGMAALLPVGRFAIMEAGKSDRAGACGRAGLRDIKVRRMLDSTYWSAQAAAGGRSFAVDPLGVFGGMPGTFAGTIPRITLTSLGGSQALIDEIFIWQDDLIFTRPEDMSPPPTGGSNRPVALTTPVDTCQGNYSWFFTVMPSTSEAVAVANGSVLQPTEFHYLVSVVVCFRRNLAVSGETTVGITPLGGFGMGGGDVLLASSLNVRENEWIALCGSDARGVNQCRWYRVVSVGDDNLHLSLNGPDWPVTTPPTSATSIGKSVVGVYTTPVEVDKDTLW